MESEEADLAWVLSVSMVGWPVRTGVLKNEPRGYANLICGNATSRLCGLGLKPTNVGLGSCSTSLFHGQLSGGKWQK